MLVDDHMKWRSSTSMMDSQEWGCEVPKCGFLNLLLLFSGRSPRAQSLDLLEGRGYSAEASPPAFDALNITVPGAAACWCDACADVWEPQGVCVSNFSFHFL